MKLRDLERHLRTHQAELLRQGARRGVWAMCNDLEIPTRTSTS